MKKFCIIFLLSIIISLTAFGLSDGGRYASNAQNTDTQTEYLRMHIRADSNAAPAQEVKYKVRDCVVDYLTPIVAKSETKAEALWRVRGAISGIEQVAEKELKANGFGYGARAEIRTETFPTRVYEGHTLPAGEYLALIIELGEGKGDNWWCVVYPPLCFAAPKGENVVYKSKILEIIENFRK